MKSRSDASLWLRTVAVIACAAAAGLGSQPETPQCRPVNLRIVAKKPDGGPLMGLSFGTQSHIGKDNAALAWSSVSDSAGAAEATVSIDTRATSLVVGPRAKKVYSDAPGADGRAEFQKRLDAFRSSYALPAEVRVRVPAGATSLHVSYQALAATSLSGRLINASGNVPITDGSVWVEGYLAESDSNSESGVVKMIGVPAGMPIWIAADWGARTVYRDLTTGTGPYAMGDWALTHSDLTAVVSVTVPVPTGSLASKAISAVSFVRSDGRDVFTFYVRRAVLSANAANPDGLIGSSIQSADLIPRVSAGTYYVFPDLWGASEAHTAFIRRLRAGDVPPAAIPKFIVTAGQSVSGSIDSHAVRGAVTDWVRPYVESNGQSGLPPSP